MAAGNARRLGLAHRARIEPGRFTDVTSERRFALILCNPPYIAADAPLPREVAGYEPDAALYSGPQGRDALRQVAAILPGLLAPGGVACIEIGHDQGAWATALFRAAGLRVALRQDLGGRDRCVVATP